MTEAAIDWTIVPNAGIGPLRFGMTSAQVAAADRRIGPPQHSHREFDGSISEARGLMMPQMSYLDDRLVSVDAAAAVPRVRFDGLDVFATGPELVIRHLYERNGGALTGVGSVLFLGLGINTGGFLDVETMRFKQHDDGRDEYRTLAVFAPGCFDALLDEMQPIDLSRAKP